MKLLFLLCLAAMVTSAGDPGLITSHRAPSDFEPAADADSPHWKGVAGVFAEHDPRAEPVPGHRTEIRSRWTDRHLYFLFICPYAELHLKPNPTTTTDTNKLWNWDVAEVFLGTDFQDIRRYKEFELSPQGEWIDLDINSDHLDADNNLKWNSGFQVAARIDRANKVWYGEMKIPMASIDSRPAGEGNQMRINFYRAQGPPPERKYISWQPTNARTFHVPESFGRLVLGK
jgi:hypothetical protein